MDYDDNVEGNNHDDDDNDDDEVGDDNEDGDSDDDDNDVDDDDDGVDDDGDDDDEVFEAPSAGQFTVCAADLDSCIVPMKTSELETLFPSLQMATLVNHPVFIKDLKDVICVAEFGCNTGITVGSCYCGIMQCCMYYVGSLSQYYATHIVAYWYYC